jgi:hypothetical protein
MRLDCMVFTVRSGTSVGMLSTTRLLFSNTSESKIFYLCAYMLSSRLYEGNLSVDGMSPQKSWDEKKVRIS